MQQQTNLLGESITKNKNIDGKQRWEIYCKIIGHLREKCRREILSFGEATGKDIKYIWKETQCNSTIDASGIFTCLSSGTHGYAMPSIINKPQQIIRGSQGNRVYSTEGLGVSIKSLGGGQGAKTGLYAVRYPLKFLNRNQKNIEGDYSYTVDGANTGGILENQRIRRLTPRECELLQGFEKDWTKYGINEQGERIEISDTQRYKMCGNAVSVPVIKAISEKI